MPNKQTRAILHAASILLESVYPILQQGDEVKQYGHKLDSSNAIYQDCTGRKELNISLCSLFLLRLWYNLFLIKWGGNYKQYSQNILLPSVIPHCFESGLRISVTPLLSQSPGIGMQMTTRIAFIKVYSIFLLEARYIWIHTLQDPQPLYHSQQKLFKTQADEQRKKGFKSINHHIMVQSYHLFFAKSFCCCCCCCCCLFFEMIQTIITNDHEPIIQHQRESFHFG